jgi:hypothetical protein
MREICLSGSMSGNRNQNQVKPDCGDEAKANSIIHRETTVTAPYSYSGSAILGGDFHSSRRAAAL